MLAIETGATTKYPLSDRLVKETTFVSSYGEVVSMGVVKDGFIYVPREMYPLGAIDKRSEGEEVTLKSILGVRDAEQGRVLKESLGYLSKGRSHIIQAGTGSGKTAISLMLAAAIGRKTLIVLTKQNLMDQWKREITKFLGIGGKEVGTIQQKVCDVEGKPIVVAMLHSLCKDKYPVELLSQFGLVIYDEVHNVSAETFSVAARILPAKLRLGLSATPVRRDGKDLVIRSHIGPILVVSDRVMLKPKIIHARTIYQVPLVTRRIAGGWDHVPMETKPGRLVNLFKDMGSNLHRNMMIVEFVKQAYNKGRSIVIFSELIDSHLRILHELLIGNGLPAKDIGFYIGGMLTKELDSSKAKPIVLATYAICKEAVDVPWWDTAVLATPRSDIKQTVGRILREYPDKKPPIVFDLIDSSIPVLNAYYQKRYKQYMELGAEILR